MAFSHTHTQVTGLAQGEEFNLDNISGSGNEDIAQPVRQSGGHPQEVTPLVQGEGSSVNDPSIAPSTDSKPAADICYFFNKSPENFTCKECSRCIGVLDLCWFLLKHHLQES